MPVTFETCEAQGTIHLEGAIDIACAAQLKGVLLEALASGLDLRISLATTTDLDVTAAQLLWAAARAASAAHLRLRLEAEPPQALREALHAAGFETFPIGMDAAGEVEV